MPLSRIDPEGTLDGSSVEGGSFRNDLLREREDDTDMLGVVDDTGTAAAFVYTSFDWPAD